MKRTNFVFFVFLLVVLIVMLVSCESRSSRVRSASDLESRSVVNSAVNVVGFIKTQYPESRIYAGTAPAEFLVLTSDSKLMSVYLEHGPLRITRISPRGQY